MFNSIHNVKMLSKMSYLLLMFTSSPCQNRRIAKCPLPESQKLRLEITVLARLIAECLEIKKINSFSCQSNLPFCGKNEKGIQPQLAYCRICKVLSQFAFRDMIRTVTNLNHVIQRAPSCRETFRPQFVFVWFRESNEI